MNLTDPETSGKCHEPRELVRGVKGNRVRLDLAHALWYSVDGGQLVAGDAGREAVAVGSLDQQGAGMNVTRLGDGSDAAEECSDRTKPR